MGFASLEPLQIIWDAIMEAALEQAIKETNSALPGRKLDALIERTNLSADMKALLSDLANITLKVGQTVLTIGRKVLTIAFDLLKAFPTITLGAIAALIITALIASIPLFGGVLAGMLSSILLVLGISAGALQDFRHPKLGERIDNLIASLSGLASV